MTGTSYSFGVLALVAAISALAFAARRCPDEVPAVEHGCVGGSDRRRRRPLPTPGSPRDHRLVGALQPMGRRRRGTGRRADRRPRRGKSAPTSLGRRRVASHPVPSVVTRGMVAITFGLVAIVVAQWFADAAPGLTHGMQDLDTLRYHGPFAARSGSGTQHLRHPVHVRAEPGALLPGQQRVAQRVRHPAVRPRSAHAAGEFRLARAGTARRLVRRQATRPRPRGNGRRRGCVFDTIAGLDRAGLGQERHRRAGARARRDHAGRARTTDGTQFRAISAASRSQVPRPASRSERS